LATGEWEEEVTKREAETEFWGREKRRVLGEKKII